MLATSISGPCIIPGSLSPEADEAASGTSAGSCVADEGLDSSGRLLRILVFPDPDDLPTSPSQLRIGISVSAPIGLDLLTPEVSIAGGPGCVLGAAVPEASIDEDGHPWSWERNVDAPAFVGQNWGIHSVTEATRVQ